MGGAAEPGRGQGPRGGPGRCAPAGPRAARHPASSAARASPPAPPARPAPSLTHGLGHLQLLVEPLAQDLRHGSTAASASRRGNQARGLASPVAKGNLLPRKRIQGKRGRGARARSPGNPALPPAGGMTALRGRPLQREGRRGLEGPGRRGAGGALRGTGGKSCGLSQGSWKGGQRRNTDGRGAISLLVCLPKKPVADLALRAAMWPSIYRLRC